MDCQVLLDAPGEPRKRIQIARLGPVKDKRYGDFDITAENVENWKRNLAALPGQRALIDFEHRSEKSPRNSEAAGWITDIALDGAKVMADAEWSDKGADAVRNKRYLFLSPAYGKYVNEHGETFEDTLCSTALTNKPVLGSLPMLTLASPERVAEALDEDPALRFHARALDGEYGETARALVLLDVSQSERDRAHAAGHSLPDKSYPINNAKQLHSAAVLAASGHGDVKAAKALIRRRAKDLGVDVSSLPGFADSQRTMDAQDLIKTLDLADTADDAQILQALAALKETASKADKLERKLTKNPVKTLEQQAKDAGLVVRDAKAIRTLEANALAGAEASRQLHEQRFDTAFNKALADPEGARVKPAERDSLKHFYTLDADATVKLIEERDPIVSTSPVGAATIDLTQEDADPQQVMAAGLHPGQHLLHQQIERHMREKDLPRSEYSNVLDQYSRGEITF